MGRNVVRKEPDAPTKRDDLYSWAVRQAELLRAGRLSEIDPVAIAEEIETWARKNTIGSKACYAS